MAIGWLKKLFGKNKNNVGNMGPIESVYSNPYYEDNDNFAENPLFQEPDNFVPNPVEEKKESVINVAQKAEAASEPSGIGANFLENIGGMPTRASIDMMAGGLKMEKIGKHKNVAKALNALERYQQIMEQSHTITMNLEKMRRQTCYKASDAEVNINGEDAEQAFESMKEFIIHAEKVARGANGLFARKSSNIQKLAPVFSNLLVQAYSILQKLSHMETLVAPYAMATDSMTYTYSEILNHQVSGGRSGGLATKGVEAGDGAFALNPKQALKLLKDDGTGKDILSLRKDKTTQARMEMKIPVLPAGALNMQKQEAATEEQIQKLQKNAETIANNYIAELKHLTTALDDIAESHEFSNWKVEREGVHHKQAEHFRLSRLFYRIMQNKNLLKQIIVNGFSEDSADSNYLDFMKFHTMGGMTLSSAVTMINQEAQDASTFTRLVNDKGEDLIESNENGRNDYIVSGGQLSIAILDFANRRVLRTEKVSEDSFLSEEEQKVALNGIYDEAAGKLSDFLGFGVSAHAEAAGFMGKLKGGKEEHAVFGGSIMEMVDGKTANGFNFSLDDENKTSEEDQGKGFPTVNLMKNGRLIGDIMKMQVMDYIMMHGDRNNGNFMINMDAKENESMVKAIDNDLIFGMDGGVRDIGFHSSKDAVVGINNNIFMDFGLKLETAFPMMTQEIKDRLESLDLEALNEMLMPYVDRVARMAAVHRAAELKAWAKKVPTCDLTKEEDTKEYVNASLKNSLKEWTSHMSIKDSGLDTSTASIKFLPGTLARFIADPLVQFPWTYDHEVIKVFKAFGLSKAETEELLFNNVSSSNEKDQQFTEEEFKKTKLYEELLKAYAKPEA